MLITRASLLDGRVADIRLARAIREVAPRLQREPNETVVDARLGAVLPGLHDHHLHLRATAAALDSVAVGPPAVRTQPQFVRAVATAAPASDGWIRATGYHESVAGELNRLRLDALAPATPLRVQHRSGAMWFLNSAALERIGALADPDGRLASTDPRLAGSVPRRESDLSGLGRQLATSASPVSPTPRPISIRRYRLSRNRFHRRTYDAWRPARRILHDDRLDLDELSIMDRRTPRRRPAGGSALRYGCATRGHDRRPSGRGHSRVGPHRTRRDGARRLRSPTSPSRASPSSPSRTSSPSAAINTGTTCLTTSSRSSGGWRR